MISCSISIPDTTVKALGYKESEIGIHLKKEMAVYFFQRNVLSFGQARQLAEMPVWDFLDLLRERKVHELLMICQQLLTFADRC